MRHTSLRWGGQGCSNEMSPRRRSRIAMSALSSGGPVRPVAPKGISKANDVDTSPAGACQHSAFPSPGWESKPIARGAAANRVRRPEAPAGGQNAGHNRRTPATAVPPSAKGRSHDEFFKSLQLFSQSCPAQGPRCRNFIGVTRRQGSERPPGDNGATTSSAVDGARREPKPPRARRLKDHQAAARTNSHNSPPASYRVAQKQGLPSCWRETAMIGRGWGIPGAEPDSRVAFYFSFGAGDNRATPPDSLRPSGRRPLGRAATSRRARPAQAKVANRAAGG